MEAVRSAKWCPIRNTLAICTGNTNVYFWSPEVRKAVGNLAGVPVGSRRLGLHVAVFAYANIILRVYVMNRRPVALA